MIQGTNDTTNYLNGVELLNCNFTNISAPLSSYPNTVGGFGVYIVQIQSNATLIFDMENCNV